MRGDWNNSKRVLFLWSARFFELRKIQCTPPIRRTKQRTSSSSSRNSQTRKNVLLFNFDSVTKRGKKIFSCKVKVNINKKLKKKKSQLHWDYIVRITCRKKRERDRVMYCCRLWCYLEVSEIVEWSKREDMHIKFAQYIQAQEIFARWGHCHRPSAHVPLSILSKHWELSCTSLFVSLCAAKVSKQASEYMRDGKRVRDTWFVRRLDIMYLCKCTAQQSFFSSSLHCGIVWVCIRTRITCSLWLFCLVLSYRSLCATAAAEYTEK